MGLSPEARFGFGYTVRLRGFCLDVLESMRMQECAIVLGSCSFRESRDKSGSTVRLAGKGWKLSGGKCLFFFG